MLPNADGLFCRARTRQYLIGRANSCKASELRSVFGDFVVFVFFLVVAVAVFTGAFEVSAGQSGALPVKVQGMEGVSFAAVADRGGKSGGRPAPDAAIRPDVQGAPVVPETRAVPETPDMPDAPDIPATPDAPDVTVAPIRLFGTVEFRSIVKNLPKWERVRDSEIKIPSFIKSGMDTKDASTRERWKKLKQTIADAPLKDKVQQVNNFFNQWPYRTDLAVWSVEDYWATPREFVEHSGDCEDYAIAKYYALRDLGVPASSLRVTAIKDTIRNLGHAILVVYMEDDARILDNLTNLVLSHTKLKHYMPFYSVNEEYLWRHVKPKSVPAKK